MSLLSPAERGLFREAVFSQAHFEGRRLIVPLWGQPSLSFDLEARRVSGPCELSFDEITRCDIDRDVHEGDEKTHHLFFLALGAGEMLWVFRERAKEYHNDMSASNDDRHAVAAKLATLPVVCGLPHRSTLTPSSRGEGLYEKKAPEPLAQGSSGACGCLALLLALAAWLSFS